MGPVPRKVLLTTSTFPEDERDAATARFVLELARQLSRHLEVVVLAPGAPGAPARARWNDVTVVRFPYFLPSRLQRLAGGSGMLSAIRTSFLARLQVPPFLLAQWAMLPGLVRREGIELVNAHWIVPQGVTAAAWRRRLSIQLVVTAHGADVALLRRARGGRACARWILDRADYLVADSRSLARELEALVGRALPWAAVPMGVGDPAFVQEGDDARLRREPGERAILFVGKLVPKKGVPVLLEAVARLRAEGERVRLVVIGGGPLDRPLRERAEALGLSGAVEFLGWIENGRLPAYFRAADVVSVPSVRDEHGETEGTPVVLQEALAAGALVVGSDSAGIPDVLRDGENGWLVPPGDAPRLAAALRQALNAPEAVRAAVRQAARRAAAEHTWPVVAERYLNAFREAAARASSRGGA